MSSGLYSGVSGLALGIGLYKGVSGLWSGASGLINGFGGADPFSGATLYLNMLSGSLDSRVTFTRSTTATFVGSDGLIQSAAVNVPRFDYDPVTLAPLGLLIEETRTNVVLQSENFATSWLPVTTSVTTNTTVAPDGTTSADTLTPTGGAGSYVRQPVTFTGDGSKAYSVFLKAGTSTLTRLVLRDTTPTATNRGSVDITWTAGVPSAVATLGTLQGVDAYPNGWYRIRALAVGVVAANSNEFRFSPDVAAGTGTTIFWGAQAENGAFSTSYIPTTTAPLPRNADIATMTGTNFSSWYNASEGTFFASFEASPNTFTTYLAASNGVVAQNSMHMDNDGAGNMRAAYYSASAPVALLGLGPVGTLGAVNNMATAYKVNDFAASRNGGTAVVDTLGAVPVGVAQLNIGADPSGAATNVSNTHIRQIAYFNTRLPDARLEALTLLPPTLRIDFLNDVYEG